MNIYAEIKTANTNNLEKFISYFIVVLTVILCVIPTVGLAQIATFDRDNQVVNNAHNSDNNSKKIIEDENKKLKNTSLVFLRTTLFAFFIWVLRSLVIYNAGRIHTIELLKKDIKSRWESSGKALEYLKKWLKVAKSNTNPPYLKIEREQHLVLPAVQDSARKILWFEEAWNVRTFYRHFELIEVRAANIARLYASYLEQKDCRGKDTLINAIEANYEYIEGVHEAYKEACEQIKTDNGYTRDINIDAKNISEMFFFSRVLIYFPLFILPVSLLFIATFILYSVNLTELSLDVVYSKLTSSTYCIYAFFIGLVSVIIGYLLYLFENKKMSAFSRKVQGVIEDKAYRMT